MRTIKFNCETVLVCFLCAATSAASADSLRTVAVTGDRAPDTNSGVEFVQFGAPSLNSIGQTGFGASLTDNTVIDGIRGGIWSEGSGALANVTRNGDQAPGLPSGVSFEFFGSLAFNVAGQTSFLGLPAGDALPDNFFYSRGIWSDSSGTLDVVAGPGQPVLDTLGGEVFGAFTSQALLNDSGQTAFVGVAFNEAKGTGFRGIWVGDSNALHLAARTGVPAPGTPPGVHIDRFDFHTQIAPVLNAAGQTAFVARLSGPGVDSSNRNGIWIGNSELLQLVARNGDQAAGMPAGVRVTGVGSEVSLNSRGQVAFIGGLTECGDGGGNCSGLIIADSTTLNVVARNGSQAVGTSIGVNYSSLAGFGIGRGFVLNSAGQTAFISGLTGDGVDNANNFGFWSEGFGALHLVARKGDHAADTPLGVNFGPLTSDNSQLIDTFVLNSAGQSAFRASLVGDGVDSTNDGGIWAEDRTGALRMIVREGDAMQVAPGEYRTVDTLGFISRFSTGNDDGRPSGFNDLGQVAFRANFTDGTSGIFVSNLVAVPEPATLLLGTMAALALIFRSKRKS